MQLRFIEEDRTLYEDDRIAVELGNYKNGATIFVHQKLAGGTMFRKYPLGDLVEIQEDANVG